jgi:glycosyltransferase involved in cell wall biosynthesis
MPATHPTVCIDCSPLLVRSAGVKTYYYHWLEALLARSPDTIRTFLAPGELNQLLHPGGLRMYPRQISTLLALNWLPAFFTRMAAPRCDVFHISNLLHRSPGGSRLSATLHDLTPWILPECHTPRMVAADKAFAARVLARAAGIIAVSENTKRDAVRILNLDPRKIHVIYPGVSDRYFGVTEQAAKSAAAFFDLRKPYFLSVGTIEPRKNLDRLLTAWESLPDSFRHHYDLAIAGMPGWRSAATAERIRQASQGGRVRYLGYVPESVMPGLTARATALVYPSLYEGFGLPVAQAMAAGCPVIASATSSLPEITGGAALLVAPLSAGDIANAILQIADSVDLRAKLRAEGLAQAARFTWDYAAASSLRYFAQIAG